MAETRLTEAQVTMLATSAVLYELPPDLREIVRSEAWWQALVGRSERELTEMQRRMLDALGIPFPDGAEDEPGDK